MSQAIENVQDAQQRAAAGRPRVGGFPYVAETFRQSGVTQNIWILPAAQSLYKTDKGPVVSQGTPLTNGLADVPPFNVSALIKAIRSDQAGKSVFPEFLQEIWEAGIVRYVVDFVVRTVTYYGCNDELYVESYPSAEINNQPRLLDTQV